MLQNTEATKAGAARAEEVYHSAQARGFTWGAVRTPEALLDDAHLHDSSAICFSVNGRTSWR